MNICFYVLIGIFFMVIILLLIKVHLLRKSAKEIKLAFEHILNSETNNLICISSRDKELCDLAESINIQLRKLRCERQLYQQGNLEIKESITNISHDLRTPLTAICGYLDLLEQEEDFEKVKKYNEVIKNRTMVLNELIEELFNYSVITSSVNETSFEEVSLNSSLEEIISVYYASLKERKIKPNISITENEIKRNLNKKILYRILENIISNAIKYSDGDLSITLSEKGEIVFSNHASKLNEIQVGKLFNRFYTVETAEKSTGLGLSIAKVLTEEMGGIINANYDDNKINVCIVFPNKP